MTFPTYPVGFFAAAPAAPADPVISPPLYSGVTYSGASSDPAPVTTAAQVQFNLLPNGTFSASGGDSFFAGGPATGSWHEDGPTAGLGNDYQARIALVRTGGTATTDFITNNATDWATINVTRTVSAYIERNTVGADTAEYEATIEIRRLSDSVVVSTGLIGMSLLVDKT